MRFALEVYRKDGSRYAAHHCDGMYDFYHQLDPAVRTATEDPEVGEVRVKKMFED
jgi:hypothetical protein